MEQQPVVAESPPAEPPEQPPAAPPAADEQAHALAQEPEPAPAVEEEPPPDEVDRDLEAELGRFDQAAAAEQGLPAALPATQAVAHDPLAYDASYGLSKPAPDAFGDYPQPPAAAEQRQQVGAPLLIAKTLDDLYGQYPKLDSGEMWLHVERKTPTTFHGRPCKGWIENAYERYTMDGFRERYGGGTYVLRVQGPTVGGGKTRTHATIEITIAGEPRFPEENEPMNQHAHRFGVVPGGRDPSVEKTRLQLEHDERVRQDQRADDYSRRLVENASKGPDWGMMNELADKRAEEVRNSTAESMGALRAHNERLQRQLEERDAALQELRTEKDVEIHKLRDESLSVRQEAANLANQQETARIRELKENHERELGRTKEDQSEKLTRLTDNHERSLKDLSDRHERERGTLMDGFDRERSGMRETSERREQQLIQDAKTRDENTRLQYESRLTEAHRSTEHEIRSVKDGAAQQVLSVQTTEAGKSHSAERTADMQIQIMQGQSSRLEQQVDVLSRENEQLRTTLQKDPLTAITEAQQLVNIVGGNKDEGEMDWKKGLVQVFRNLADKAPDVAKEFSQVREQNRALHQQQQQQQPRAAMRPPGAPQMSTAVQQQRRQAHRAPPPGYAPPAPDAGPMGWTPQPTATPAPLGASGAPPPGSAAPLTVSHAPVAVPISPVQPGIVEEAPTMAATAPTPPPPPVVQAPAPPPVVAQPQQPEPAQAPAFAVEENPTGEQPEVSAEAINEFVEELETAIRGGLIAPSVFAKSFVERVGPEETRVILSRISPDQFVDGTIQAGGQQSAIVTRGGRAYVEELWVEAKKLVGLPPGA